MNNKVYIFLLAIAICTKLTAISVDEALQKASDEQGIPVNVLRAVCTVESNLKPHVTGDSDNGEPSIGLCQIKYSTAVWQGFKGKVTELYKPLVNARYAAKHIKYLLKKHDDNWRYAVAEYNYGRLRFNNKGQIYNRSYVAKVERVLTKERMEE